MPYTDITPQEYPLYENKCGDDWRIPIPVYQSDRTSEWDFSLWQAFAQVRTKTGGDVIATFDTYEATIEFVGGIMYLIADKDFTRQLEEYAGFQVWECQFHDPFRGLDRTLIPLSPFEITKDGAK